MSPGKVYVSHVLAKRLPYTYNDYHYQLIFKVAQQDESSAWLGSINNASTI